MPEDWLFSVLGVTCKEFISRSLYINNCVRYLFIARLELSFIARAQNKNFIALRYCRVLSPSGGIYCAIIPILCFLSRCLASSILLFLGGFLVDMMPER